MSSSLRVNAIVPSSGNNVAIGTAGGTITYGASVTGVSTFSTLNATSIVGVNTLGVTTAYVGSINDGPLAGTRNKIINGNFDVWQRGTSFTNMVEATTYTADRWSCYRDSYTTGITVSQISGISQNGVNRNALRVQRNSGNTSTAGMNATQSLESINSRDLAGQTVTLSFWARCGSNYSSSGSNLVPVIYSGTGTDQSSRGAVTGYSLVVSSNRTLTTSFQRFSVTGTIPSNANQIFVQFYYTPTGTAGTNDFFDIMDVQLEPGTVATPFERRSYGQELALCLRYLRPVSHGTYGRVTGTTTICFFPAYDYMRASPTVSLTSGSIVGDNGSSSVTATSPSVSSTALGSTGGRVFIGGFSGLTINDNWPLAPTGASILLSAEL
jgi:hypothetical protein